jgi:hypothetical protein
MELERDSLVSPSQAVLVVEGELVATIRELASRGVGSKAIARTVGLARNTVRRYLREPIAPGVQVRPENRGEALSLADAALVSFRPAGDQGNAGAPSHPPWTGPRRRRLPERHTDRTSAPQTSSVSGSRCVPKGVASARADP